MKYLIKIIIITTIVLNVILMTVRFSFARFTASSQIVNNTFSTGSWAPPSAPLLLAPVNDLITNIDQVFSWQAPATFSFPPLSYIFEIYSTDSSLPSPTVLLHQENLSELHFPTIDFYIFPLDGNYWWHVAAVDVRGTQGAWSETRKIAIDRTAPTTTISVENSPRRQINEQINDGTFEKYSSTEELSPDFTYQGQIELVKNNAHQGQTAIKIGKDDLNSYGGYLLNNNISYSFINNSKTLSFYYNFFTSDLEPFDDPGFIFRINGENIFQIAAKDAGVGWKQFFYDISERSGSLSLEFLAGNDEEGFRPSWVYLDEISTGLTVINNNAKFFLNSLDNLSAKDKINQFYCLDNCSADSENWREYQAELNLNLSQGQHNLYYYAKDELGNAESLQLKQLYFDSEPPQKISDLSIKSIATSSAVLVFSAPANDGATASGKIDDYEIKISDKEVTDASSSGEIDDWWQTANKINKNLVPEEPTVLQEFSVDDLNADKNYYCAIKSFDAAVNYSPISNIVNIYISPTPTPTETPTPTSTPTPEEIPTATPTPTETPTPIPP